MAAGDVSVQFPKVYRDSPNDGTVSGGVTISDGAIFGDGTGAISMGDVELVTIEATWSIWVNKSSSIAGQGLLGKYKTATPDRSYAFQTGTTAGEPLRILLSSTGNIQYDRSVNSNSFNVGELVNFIIVYKGGEYITTYKNGVLTDNDTTSIPTSIYDGTGNLQILKSENTNSLNGSIPQVQVFNRALTQSEITQIYNAGKDAYSPVTNGLVAQYSGRDYAGTALLPTKIYDTKNINPRSEDDSFIDTAISEMRVNANSKFLMVPGNRGQVYVTHIEEA